MEGLRDFKLFIRANAHFAQVLEYAICRILARDEFLKSYGVSDARINTCGGWHTLN